jgi:tetratricopeptide (TPR) repeat protein
MTNEELVGAARHALASLEDERELRGNPLLRERSAPHETLRSIVLDALDSLDPAGVGSGAISRQKRFHDILVHCDLRGELHKVVIKSLGISRREFYRERRQAMLALATAIQRMLERHYVVIELGDAARTLVEVLRSAGQYEAVWREATSIAGSATDHVRETKYWIIASEAASYLGHAGDARDAFERARRSVSRLTARERPRSLALWTAIGEMNLQWSEADFDGALATFERATHGRDEQTIHGDESILFSIMLAYATSMELDCGRWDRARSLLGRATRLAEYGGSTLAGRFAIASQSLRRLSAQFKLSVEGNVHRSIEDHRVALDADRAAGHLGGIAVSAAYYAAALGEVDTRPAAQYAEYALEIVRRFYTGDRLARLTLELLPLLLRAHGPAFAQQAVAGVKREGQGARDLLFLDLAEAKLAAHTGALPAAIERAEEAAAKFTQHRMHAWACDAHLLAIESSARLGHRPRARRQLQALTEMLRDTGRAKSRTDASRLSKLLTASQ